MDQVVETIDGVSATSTYEYDKHGRLVEYTPGFPSGYGTIVYEYNNLGQKTSMTVPLGVADKAKKICYSYDSEGKLVGTHVLPATATSSVSTATSDPGDLRFYYDDNGNRVKLINEDGDVYYFVYDPTASIPAVLVEIEATGSSQYLNIREPDGSLVSRETYNDSGTMTCHRTYHFDGLGSVVALSDEFGTLTDKYTYDEWGNVTHTDPDTGDQIGLTLDNPYQYVGKYGYYTHHQQTDFKLLQLGVRYYDPETGRFTQKDPAKDGLNWYAYVGGNPLARTDPTGLCSVDVCSIMNSLFNEWWDREVEPRMGIPRGDTKPRPPSKPIDWDRVNMCTLQASAVTMAAWSAFAPVAVCAQAIPVLGQSATATTILVGGGSIGLYVFMKCMKDGPYIGPSNPSSPSIPPTPPEWPFPPERVSPPVGRWVPPHMQLPPQCIGRR